MNSKNSQTSHCSFCNQPLSPSSNVVQGKNSVICYRCINQFKNILDQKINRQISSLELKEVKNNILYPDQIFDQLNQFVIGQEEAKRILSVAVYCHYKRISYLLEKDSTSSTEEIEIDKSNVLLIGPSGSGKTLLASTLAKVLKVPFAIADATTLTEAGYVGEDVENILLRLIQNADYKIPWAEKGIIFIDEIDKIGRKSENTSLTRDVSGEGVQQALLKIIEGTQATVPSQGGRKHPQSQNIPINTKNILFICGGAFIGIEELVKKRMNTNTIGFKGNQSQKSDKKDTLEIIPEDLIRFGLIPELVGRLPVITSLKDLTEQELKKILIEPKNSLVKQYQKLIGFENKDLIVKEDALDYVVEKSQKYNIGARALRNIMEKIMLEIIFQTPRRKEKKIVLSRKTIEQKKFFKN